MAVRRRVAPAPDRRVAVAGHRRFRHEALFYQGTEDFLGRAGAAVLAAVGRGDPVRVVVEGRKLSLLRERLGSAANRVELLDMERVGRSPARIIPLWQEWIDRVGGAGRYPCGIGEPVWAGRDAVQLDDCHQHEMLLNLAFGDASPWLLLCPYDCDSLDTTVMDGAEDSHPTVIDRSARRRDGRFRPGADTAALDGPPLQPPVPAEVRPIGFAIDDLPGLRDEVTSQAEAAGMAPRRVRDLALAVNELAANSIRHGGGRGTLRIWVQDDGVVCEVRDRGHITDPLVGRVRPTSEERGCGLWLVNQLCDLLQLRSSQQGGTRVRVRMRLGSGESAD